MSFITKIKDLQDHLLKCSDKKVFIVASFKNTQELFNYSKGCPTVWITPLGATRKDSKKGYTDCGGIYTCEFVLSLAYYCPKSVIGGFVPRMTCEDDFCGPIVDADKCLCEVIECIQEFNCEQAKVCQGMFTTYNLKEFLRPIFDGGCVLLQTVWEKESNICF